MKFTLIISIVSAFLLEGCLEAPVEPKGGINGIVYNSSSGLPIIGVFVRTSSYYPIVETYMNGNFAFPQQSTPYDLYVGRDPFYADFKFLGLKSSSTIICVPEFTDPNIRNLIDVRIYFPPLKSRREVYLKFMGNSTFSQDNYNHVLDTGINSYGTYLIAPQGVGSISGKLVYLESMGPQNPMEFKRFGMKDVVLNIGENYVTFDSSNITNINSAVLTCFNVIPPAHSGNVSTSVSLCIPGMNRGSELELDDYFYTSGCIYLPIFNGANYQARIYCQYFDESDTIGINAGEIWSYISPGGNVTITADDPPQILSPVYWQSNVTDTTTFAISDNGERGVYQFTLRNWWGGYDVPSLITDKKTVKFIDFRRVGQPFPANGLYFFQIMKFPNYNSIDDFVSVKYTEDNRYNSIPISNVVRFTTAP